jgi:glycosyltransferase involved in cell wall biosynthesis
VKRLKVLISAYACEPEKGSEPGIGWNIVREAARYNDVWVLTRANNRAQLEAAIEREQLCSLHPLYHDLPSWIRAWKRGPGGVHFYYYLWQLTSAARIKQLHAEVGFDLTQHCTFGRYWSPTPLARLPVPFIWGPVGGGESAPFGLWSGIGLRGGLYELLRALGRWCGERDPLVQAAAQSCALALAVTSETASRLRRLGVRDVEIFSAMGLGATDLSQLGSLGEGEGMPFRFLSSGRLLHWKGFHLGIQAFAAAELGHAEYWLIGGGPEEARLRRLARKLGVANRVRFWGAMSRPEALEKLASCHVLVHPSLHDSGGWVCLEAMAAGRPVLCLDLGGPAEQARDGAGIRVPARTAKSAVQDLAAAMVRLQTDPELRLQMGRAARLRARMVYAWASRGEVLNSFYHQVTQRG